MDQQDLATMFAAALSLQNMQVPYDKGGSAALGVTPMTASNAWGANVRFQIWSLAPRRKVGSSRLAWKCWMQSSEPSQIAVIVSANDKVAVKNSLDTAML